MPSEPYDTHEALARAICRETCAYRGEPPCFMVEDGDGKPLPWPNPDCDEPGCHALAAAAVLAISPEASMTDRPHDDRADRPEREEARLEAVRQAGGVECEAGAQQDMRAATWLDAQADEHRKLGFRSSAALLRECAAEIRALSPIPPGYRVVVVPPEGSAAWEYAAGAAFAALPPDAYGTIGAGEMYRVIRAALRALTGGEP